VPNKKHYRPAAAATANTAIHAASPLQDECEGELAVAMPLLESALVALNTLTKADITEVRSMKNPPGPVKVTMEAVCQLLNVKPKKVSSNTLILLSCLSPVSPALLFAVM
jgi:dynein heavy chain